MRKIRVVFVVTNCKENGPIRQTWNIIKNLDRNIFEPALLTIWAEEASNSIFDDYRQLGIRIFCCNLSKKMSLFRGRTTVTYFLKEFNPDIVQSVGMPPYRMTLGYKDTIHFTTLRNYCYDDYPDQYGKLIGTVMAFVDIRLIRKQMKLGKPFVTCSKSLSKLYQKRQRITIDYIRNGVDVNKFIKRDAIDVSELRMMLNLPTSKIIFVYSGALIDRKNQGEAIDAFVRMKNNESAVLLLLGDGKDKKRLEHTYSKYNNIFFRGKVANINDYLNASDVYLSTSKSEGLPNGVLEAMACGLPVILSDIPQHMEVLEADPTCGYAYKLGNVEMLAKLLDDIMQKDLLEIGERSYKLVIQNFTAEGMSNKYQEVYLRLVKKAKLI